jgi:mycothiol synthase
VTMFTRSSVHWAERIVATSSWNGPSWTSAHSSRASPGKIAASRSTVARARPRGLRGFATTSTLPAETGDTLGPVQHVEIERREGEQDIAAVSELLHVAAHSDDHRPLGEHKWLDLVQGGRSGFSGFVARGAASRRIVGYAHLSRGPTSWAIEFVVHPAFREPGDPIATELVRAALGEIAREGGGHVHLWVAKPSPDHDAVAAATGLRRGRDLLQMRRALPVEDHVAPPLAVRAFRSGEDEDRWLEVNNRAFGSHPEQGAWDLETMKEREREPWFDPAGFLLYEEEGRLAGSCWTKVHAEEPPIGEIYVIAVDPAFQGRGLGRALVLAGLEHLAGLGIAQAMLYVDGSNEAAVGLYRALGFEVDHVDRAYVGDVRPA